MARIIVTPIRIAKKIFQRNFTFFLTKKIIGLYLQIATMISSNHQSTAVRSSIRSGIHGGAADRNKWSEVFTMNEGRKIDCMR
jgi:hypothetical protein